GGRPLRPDRAPVAVIRVFGPDLIAADGARQLADAAWRRVPLEVAGAIARRGVRDDAAQRVPGEYVDIAVGVARGDRLAERVVGGRALPAVGVDERGAPSQVVVLRDGERSRGAVPGGDRRTVEPSERAIGVAGRDRGARALIGDDRVVGGV